MRKLQHWLMGLPHNSKRKKGKWMWKMKLAIKRQAEKIQAFLHTWRQWPHGNTWLNRVGYLFTFSSRSSRHLFSKVAKGVLLDLDLILPGVVYRTTTKNKILTGYTCTPTKSSHLQPITGVYHSCYFSETATSNKQYHPH